MSELEDKIYRIIKREGPVLPVNISRQISQGTMLVSAILTSMVKRDKINKTQQKIGSSSLYYLDSQSRRALKRIKKEMSSLQKRVYDHLKEKKVIKDKEAGAKRRAVLRKIRDFAKDFEYKDERYWRHHQTPEGRALEIIKERGEEKKKDTEEREAVEKRVDESRKKEKGEGKEIERGGEKGREEPRPEVEKGAEEVKKEAKEKIEEEPEEVGEKPEVKEGKGPEEKPEEQREKDKEEKESREGPEGSFEERVIRFLKEKGAEIVKEDVIRKKYEMNLVVKVKSLFGHRNFFVKARSKKRINEKELSLAYLEGNEKKMPVIFLTDGELTNKAQEYANKELGSVFKIVKLGESL